MRSINPFSLRLRQVGFTLIELLVAMSVLFGVTLLVTSLISNVTTTTKLSTETINADSVSRLFFDRLGNDIANMVVRDDVDYFFYKDGGNDLLGFYVNLAATAGATPVSRVYYGWPTGSTELSRAVNSLGGSWTTGIYRTAPTLSSGGSFPLPVPADLQSFGKEIIRFEYGFLTQGPGGLRFDANNTGIGINDIRGIVVAIAVLDEDVQAFVGTAGVDAVAGILGDATSADIVGPWRQALTTAQAGGGLAGSAASNVRIYQRVYLLPR